MRYAPESLMAFVEAAALGSFSAAARKLQKSQSTISAAIAHLETDLGLILFDRSGRYPVLTEEGRKVLWYAQDILDAANRLDELSIRLADDIEPRLAIVVSDTYPISPTHRLMERFASRYPDTELEILDAEASYVVDLLQRGRAQLGLLAAMADYPSDISVKRLPIRAEMALYVGKNHPMANRELLTPSQLYTARQIRLTTPSKTAEKTRPYIWSASDYMVIMEMAEQGFGWAELPQNLVRQYGGDRLKQLDVNGWPRSVPIDAVTLKQTPPGAAGLWFLEQLMKTDDDVDSDR